MGKLNSITRDLDFEGRVKIIGFLSFTGSTFLFISICYLMIGKVEIGIHNILIYICCKVAVKVIWRCPKCKSKLPKGKMVGSINECKYCKHDLRRAN